MAYESSTLISRSGYSGIGNADPAPCKCGGGCGHGAGSMGDSLTSALTSTPILIGAAVAAYFVFRPKKRKKR